VPEAVGGEIDCAARPSLPRIIMEQMAEARQEQGPSSAEVLVADAELEEDYRKKLY